MMKSPAQSYGSEKPVGYRPRVVDALVRQALDTFGAVEIRGTKWCGKSWTALAFGESVTHLDDANARMLVEADPTLALYGAEPHVVDEWQEVPPVWDATRRAVDAAGGKTGMVILTGSSTPAKDRVTHSGAGRIARVDMSTMTLWEQGRSTGSVSLAGLFAHEFTPAPAGGSLSELADTLCRGGWPALAQRSPEVALTAIEQYLDALFEVSVPQRGGKTQAARRVTASLARNVATAATLKTLAADALDEEGAAPATSTVSSYLDLLRDTYVLEELPGWDAPVRSKSRLRTKPKRYFVDPSIPAAILGVDPARLLQDGQTFGLLFESLCVHDLRVYASTLPGYYRDSLHYYADADGLEVDVIIELRDGRWGALEVKMGESKVPEALENLDRLRQKVAANPAARNPRPEFAAVLTATSPFCRYDAGHDAYVFPLSSLRP